MWRIPVYIRTGMHSAAGLSAANAEQISAGRKSTSENHMKKSSGVLIFEKAYRIGWRKNEGDRSERIRTEVKFGH